MFTTREDYAYITGAIRCLEQKIVDPIDIERMIDAPDFYEAFKILNDTDYANYLLGVSPKDFMIALNNDLKHLKDFIVKHTLDDRLVKILFLQEDWHNIKLCLKCKYLNVKLDESLLSNAAIQNPIDLKNFILSPKSNGIQPELKSSIQKIMLKLDKKANPYLIDMFCDREYFKMLKTYSLKYNNPLVTKYIMYNIDATNIKVLIRCLNLKQGREFAFRHLTKGGNIPLKEFAFALNQEKPLNTIKVLKPFLDTTFYNYLTKAIDNSDMSEFEKAKTEYIGRMVKNAQFCSYGPEVVINYFYKKNVALHNIRFILIGKVNNIAPKAIKEKIINLSSI